jgi:branched-chain amino acid transport system permease protein
MYYYTMLFLTVIAFIGCWMLLRSRAGYYWQAIRENEEAAQALGINTFRWKMAAVAISAAMTSISGVFFAFYYNNLFPEQIFHISRSIEIILGPVIGGIGTLFGPILGAAALTLLSDGITELLAALGWEVPGIKQVFYGIVLLVVVMFLPHGIWPAVARKLKIHA